MSLPITELLSRLVSIPSVNPMGSEVTDEVHGERRIGEFVAEYLQGLGLEPRTIEGPRGRNTVYALLDLGRPKTVMLEAHLDTVAPDPRQKDPFTPRIENGKLYGRGACDTKGPLAAMLTALSDVIESAEEPAVNVIFAGTVDEEYGMTGARGLAEVLQGRVHFALVGEPTRMKPALSHKGVIRWRLEVRGKAAHAATPELGENAIERAAHLIQAIEKHAGELRSGVCHPVLGHGTISVGTIRGGVGVNTVPQECEIKIDRRYLPQETPDQVEDDLRHRLADAWPEKDWTLERLPSDCIPLDVSPDLDWVKRLQTVLKAEGFPEEPISLPYATDAAFYAAHGIPAVVIGPGDAAQAHTKDEFIDLAELEKAVQVFRRFLLEATPPL